MSDGDDESYVWKERSGSRTDWAEKVERGYHHLGEKKNGTCRVWPQALKEAKLKKDLKKEMGPILRHSGSGNGYGNAWVRRSGTMEGLCLV